MLFIKKDLHFKRSDRISFFIARFISLMSSVFTVILYYKRLPVLGFKLVQKIRFVQILMQFKADWSDVIRAIFSQKAFKGRLQSLEFGQRSLYSWVT